MKRTIILATSAIAMTFAACRNDKESEYAKIITGRIVAETAQTFTLVSQNQQTILPKSLPMAYSNRIFIEDSVIVRYRELKNETKVDDIILISHKNEINNVAELFVGSWNDADSNKTMTLNADMTTSEQKKWTIDGRKMLIQDGNDTKEYNIIHIDDSQMTLCYEDQTIHMRRSYRN